MNIEELNLIRDHLVQFISLFNRDFERSDRMRWCQFYILGLLLDGERKSIQPMTERLPGANEQALQQFINQSPWDSATLQINLARHMANSLKVKKGVLILDDTTFPKKGKCSVGVAHQYCGALGKVANCQSVVTWHYSEIGQEHFPINAQLFLPQSWTQNHSKMKAVKIPSQNQNFLKKWQLSLQLLDQISKDDFPFEALVFDAGYGEVREFLRALDERKETFVAQIPESHAFWPLNVSLNNNKNSIGRSRKYPEVMDKKTKPLSAKNWLKKLTEEGATWIKVRLELKSKKYAKIMSVRLKETIAPAFYRPGAERWLIIEHTGESYKYYVSNAPRNTPIPKIVRWIHERWKIEQGYQQLKEELGLDHFEGRSWIGLHHHITVCFMAYGFLTLLKNGSKGKKNRSNSSPSKTSFEPIIQYNSLPALQ